MHMSPTPASLLALLLALPLASACGDEDDSGTADGGVGDGGAGDGGGGECFGGNDSQFELCMIDGCCDAFSACMGDGDCYTAYSCLLRCDGTFAATCEADCAIVGNAAWDALATCGRDTCGDQICLTGSAAGG